jgi:hypothetical protein
MEESGFGGRQSFRQCFFNSFSLSISFDVVKREDGFLLYAPGFPHVKADVLSHEPGPSDYEKFENKIKKHYKENPEDIDMLGLK